MATRFPKLFGRLQKLHETPAAKRVRNNRYVYLQRDESGHAIGCFLGRVLVGVVGSTKEGIRIIKAIEGDFMTNFTCENIADFLYLPRALGIELSREHVCGTPGRRLLENCLNGDYDHYVPKGWKDK